MAKNPFQSGDRQHFPAYSPSTFRVPKTPCSAEKNGSFRWSIDHIALLHPADIDDMQQDTSPLNEPDAQRSVERFFSQRMIVPSPWTQDKVPSKHVTFSPHPPDTAYIRDDTFNESTNGKMVDVSCQTSMTIPLNWDLESMLGPDCVYHEDDEQRMKDSGNTSLRRKLFGQPQRVSPNEGNTTSPDGVARHSTSPNVSDVISPISAVTAGPLLSGKMVTTPNIILTSVSPSPSLTNNRRSSFQVDCSPFHSISPIVTSADPHGNRDVQTSPDITRQGITSPKLSPIKAKNFLTPDGLVTPSVLPSSGKSTSTPVSTNVQTVIITEVKKDSDDITSSQSDCSDIGSGNHTPELLSLEDLQSNTYELTSVAIATTILDDHDNPAVTMETTSENIVTSEPTTTAKPVTMTTANHGVGVKSVSDSGIAVSSVEMSSQLRDDHSHQLQGSCNSSEQWNRGKQHDKMLPPSSTTNLLHSTEVKFRDDEHYKEQLHPSAVDSGLGYNLKTSNSHAHYSDESSVAAQMDTDINGIPVSKTGLTDGVVANGLRAGFNGALLPSKFQLPYEESTPKSHYVHSNERNRWAWLPRSNSTNGESFSSFAEEVLLRKEMLKSQLQFGPVSSLYNYSNISPATSQHSFSRQHDTLENSASYPTTPLSSRTTAPVSAVVRYRSPLSDKVYNRNHSKLNRLHLGSFRSRFNKFSLNSVGSNTPSLSTADILSPAHHPMGSHAPTTMLWSKENSNERYNDWKRSMDRWESAIKTQYATVDS